MNAVNNLDKFATLQDYVNAIRPTDRLDEQNLRPVLMGLFGEVGSIMAPVKKLHREKDAYKGYQAAAEEEFGDALWYFAALVRRTGNSLVDVISEAAGHEDCFKKVNDSDSSQIPVIRISGSEELRELDDALLKLGAASGALLVLKDHPLQAKDHLHLFAKAYLHAMKAAKISLSRVIQGNILKTRGRFLKPVLSALPTFDSAFDKDERIPEHFEIHITQRASGQSYLQWNGVFIGDPLTDNILDSDDYRFHDVFHFAHAAVLHWSPTFRALIKHKRKSNKTVDEAQDGGRAIVVEEGLTAWLFSKAKDMKLFENQSSVSFDMLKTLGEFVRGYEVEACPLKLWEDAILQGYSVFRQVCVNKGGIVIGDRSTRTLTFKPLT